MRKWPDMIGCPPPGKWFHVLLVRITEIFINVLTSQSIFLIQNCVFATINAEPYCLAKYLLDLFSVRFLNEYIRNSIIVLTCCGNTICCLLLKYFEINTKTH